MTKGRYPKLTVFITGLTEWFAFGKNNGNNEVLKAGDVEQGSVLVVLDVVFINLCGVICGGCIAGTEKHRGEKEANEFNYNMHEHHTCFLT